MRKIGVPALALAALLLTGCAATTTPAPSDGASTATEPSADAARATEPSADTSPEPLVAETTEPTTDDLFLTEARSRLGGLGAATTIPNASDDQLIAAGHQACELLIAQTPFNDVTVIEGEERVQGSFLDSAAIASAGILYFCPEMNGKTL